MRPSVSERYEAMVQAGELTPDDIQRALVARLDALVAELQSYRPPKTGGGMLARLFSRASSADPPRGLYVHGDVGRGKTLIMDLFFAATEMEPKRRVHFHAFMGEAHDRIADFRRRLKSGEAKGDDPIPPVAAEIAAGARLLCFDELAVYDIADAMILGRLFAELFKRGVVVVATSNVAPHDLYKDGLNRALFMPFVALIEERMDVFHLDAPHDYRLDSEGGERRYVVPLGPEADACLDAHFASLTGHRHGEPSALHNKGRTIAIREAAAGVARFTFEELCARPLGAGDYLKIAEAFHTLILSDVPVLQPERRNEAKRLINLIDTLYDRHVRLVVSAAAEPDALWQGRDGAEAFEFARTASRLIEMRSDAYWDAERAWPDARALAAAGDARDDVA